MRRMAILLLLICLAWPGLLMARLPDGLAGRWSGTAEAAGRTLSLQVAISPEDSGFAIDLALADIARWSSRMVPTDRAGVYQPAASRNLFGFFNGGSRSDPFDGAPVVWSRIADDGLVVYRLVLSSNGVAELLRIELVPLDDSLDLVVERRRDTEPAATWRARLSQDG